MNNSVVSAKTQLKAMISLSNNIDFKPDPAVSVEMLSMKTNVTNDCILTVEQANQGIGGQSFYKKIILNGYSGMYMLMNSTRCRCGSNMHLQVRDY